MNEYQLKHKLVSLYTERAEAQEKGLSATEYTLDKEIEQTAHQLEVLKELERMAKATAWSWYSNEYQNGQA